MSKIPLRSIRAFSEIAQELSITAAANNLSVTQSSVSRHLAVLEDYVGEKLVERRGRHIRLTQFGRILAESITEPLGSIEYAVHRMRRRHGQQDTIIVRTSLPTLTENFIIPNLPLFSKEAGGATVNLTTSLSPPEPGEEFDVLLTRDLEPGVASDEWRLCNEEIVCAGNPKLLDQLGDRALQNLPLFSVTTRPDIIPCLLAAQDLSPADVSLGATYDRHGYAIPAAIAGLGLFVGPEMYLRVSIRNGDLAVLPGTRCRSGMSYTAFALDASSNPEIARAFCRWLSRIMKS
ncbi:MAG: LysR family transcriptional regulator [Paracoccaceae bacterium]|nr:LysR family transcriptional regulator [Paracoccaceae bacterium]